ncbi:hypothetical protein [Streptomyces sp. CS62]|uniref:hypothetical protein n=1 Tax=Streptomyces sp. CS62 TaxID=3119268 RepID=UPI003FA778C1
MDGSVASGAQPCFDDEAVPALLVWSCVVGGFEEQEAALSVVEVARGGEPSGGERGPVELLAEGRAGGGCSAGAYVVEEGAEEATAGLAAGCGP